MRIAVLHSFLLYTWNEVAYHNDSTINLKQIVYIDMASGWMRLIMTGDFKNKRSKTFNSSKVIDFVNPFALAKKFLYTERIQEKGENIFR